MTPNRRREPNRKNREERKMYKSPKLKNNIVTVEQLVAAVEKWDDWTMPIYWAYSRKHRIAERYRKLPRR